MNNSDSNPLYDAAAAIQKYYAAFHANVIYQARSSRAAVPFVIHDYTAYTQSSKSGARVWGKWCLLYRANF